MGEKMNSKRQYTGCACRCGQPTYATYLPGHDAKHVSALVRYTIEAWSTVDVTTRWRGSLATLPTDALRAKFRRMMIHRARKYLGSIVLEMDSPDWLRQMGVQRLLAATDPYFDGPTKPDTLVAEAAAAMGWSRSRVNFRRS